MATPVLLEALRSDRAAVRAAAAKALGRTAGESDVPRIAAALRDGEPTVRSAVRGALADIGGVAAANALVESLPPLDEAERGDAQAALAWLGDRRDLDSTRKLAHRRLVAPYGEGIELAYRGWGSVYALIRIGNDADRLALIDAVVASVPTAIVNDPEKWWIRLREPVKSAVDRVLGHLSEAGFHEQAETARSAIEDLITEGREVEPPPGARPAPMRAVRLEPVHPRTVPRFALSPIEDDSLPDDDWSMARFGGQPSWITQPTWPLDSSGSPMRFYGQLPLLGDVPRLAYLFLSDSDDATFEPLSGANALILQPGPTPRIAHAGNRTGPQLFETVHHTDRFVPYTQRRPFRRRFSLTASADPPSWSWPDLPDNGFLETPSTDWNKIGGTPLYLQREDRPPGENWEFAFQFTAGWAALEIADGAECYGFTTPDGHGAFLWQCH